MASSPEERTPNGGRPEARRLSESASEPLLHFTGQVASDHSEEDTHTDHVDAETASPPPPTPEMPKGVDLIMRNESVEPHYLRWRGKVAVIGGETYSVGSLTPQESLGIVAAA